MSDNSNIIQDTLVPHANFAKAVKRIEQCYKYAEDSTDPICIALIGESRTGKSRVLDECLRMHPRSRNADGLTVPILRVSTPSKPTVKGLVELMLETIGDPQSTAGTENIKTSRLKKLIKSSGTRMVMIDEFQHFWDKGSRKVMHHVADWLKILADETNVALVVTGLPTCRAVLEQNEQLAGRFSAPVLMSRFDWQDGDSRNQFISILGAFYELLSEYYDLPNLKSQNMAFRFYCATGGLFGYLVKLLRQLVWNAIDEGVSVIALADIGAAYYESTGDDTFFSTEIDPFRPSFKSNPTVKLLQEVKLIGTTTSSS